MTKREYRAFTTKELERARQLKDEGLSYGAIGKRLRRSSGTIWKWLNDAYKGRPRRKQYGKGLTEAQQLRQKLRAVARSEAQQSGEAVETVYERFGCA